MSSSIADLLPPRCLQPFAPQAALPDVRDRALEAFSSAEAQAQALATHLHFGRPAEEWVPLRELSRVWSFGCPCGAREGKIFGVRVMDTFSGPLRFACLACQATAPLFDPTVDGWNRETSKKKRRPKAPPKTTFALLCRRCKTTMWEPVMLVTYQGDLDGIAATELANHFDTASFGGTCTGCRSVSLDYSEECA